MDNLEISWSIGMLVIGAICIFNLHLMFENTDLRFELEETKIDCKCSNICHEHNLSYGYYENSVKEYCVCQDITEDGVIERRYLKDDKQI